MIIKNLSDSSVVSSGFKFYYEIQNKTVQNQITCPTGFLGDNCEIGKRSNILHQVFNLQILFT